MTTAHVPEESDDAAMIAAEQIVTPTAKSARDALREMADEKARASHRASRKRARRPEAK